ncbi:hypothetical protein RFI_10228 [Reticulomyxa filosa]|uniref:Radial spoke head protein 9 homolog n=1 Tax=Reticulomyxa filosa TaxID=46433 RepID=X6NLY3_RETFI|nr:hypothetical protein RFI_10228 [Reticulomyxa filosa]|eukprot:ETO26908.1 hypothetical protein RFI_10228 [Reticulomyxa filosa]
MDVREMHENGVLFRCILQMVIGSPSYVYTENKKTTLPDNKEPTDDKIVEDNATEEPHPEKEVLPETDAAATTDKPLEQHTLTELDRLAWTVYKISEECFLVPKGYLRLNAKKIMYKNKTFAGVHDLFDLAHFFAATNNFFSFFFLQGLSQSDANKMSSYYHWRMPQSAQAISNYRKATALNWDGFLDEISTDIPNGCWRLRSTDGGFKVKLRNLLWPGFEFTYDCAEQQFKQGYFGSGIRQNDLLFLQ